MVKCANCGFLAIVKTGSWRVDDTTPLAMRGDDILAVTSISGLTSSIPTCFMQKPHLDDALNAYDGGAALLYMRQHTSVPKQGEWAVHVHKGVNTEHDCQSHTEHQIGFSPKEHREMIDRRFMLEREDQRDKEQREWQERQEERTRDFQWKSTMRAAVVGGLIVALIGFLAAVLQPLVADTEPPVVNNIIHVPTPMPASQSETDNNE